MSNIPNMISQSKKSIQKGIILMVICTILTAAGQILFKLASNNITFSILSIITNIPFWGGLILYALASIFMILAFREGDLSTIFPMISLSFVWIFIIATILFHEPITISKIIANIVIIVGVIFLGGNT